MRIAGRTKIAWIITGILLIVTTTFLIARSSSQPHTICEFRGFHGFDIEFSPDGHLLAATIATKHQLDRPDAIALYSIDDQLISAQLAPIIPREEALWNVAWDPDGESLAVSRMNSSQVEIWRRRDWTRIQTLATSGAADAVASLSFDQNSNLFAVTEPMTTDATPGFVPERAVVWHKARTVWETKAKPIRSPTCRGIENLAFSISAVGLKGESKVAVSYLDCSTQILSLRSDSSGGIVNSVQINLPEFRRAWVRLSPDGNRLAVLDIQTQTFTLFECRSDKMHKMVTARGRFGARDQLFFPTFDMVKRALDMSRDGRYVAYRFDDRIGVIRMLDGKEVFKAALKCFAVALSPDGSFLATTPVNAKRICVYSMPIP